MTKYPTGTEQIHETKGSVFADLGLHSSDRDLIKVHIALAIQQTVRRRKLSQSDAGRIMNIDQPKVSAIMRGRLDSFSLHRLIEYLLLIGRDLEIRVPEKIHDRGQIRLRA